MYLVTYEENGVVKFKATKDLDWIVEVGEFINVVYINKFRLFVNKLKCKFSSLFEHLLFKSSAQDIKLLKSDNNYSCEPSGDKYLVKLLKQLNITSNDRILDIGCGKGSAMLKFLQFPFSVVNGIDIDEENTVDCRDNLFKHRYNDSEVFLGNIEDVKLEKLKQYNYFYMFNPFDSSVMKAFLDKIVNGVRIIYKNPVCEKILKEYGFVEVMSVRDWLGVEIKVYEN